MPFERPGSGNLSGVSSATRRALKSLAMSIREGVAPDQIRDWLIQIWMGRDPLTGEAVSLKDRTAALQMLLDRGWGQAAQHVVIEGELRSEVIQVQPQNVRPDMTIEQVRARRAEIRSAVRPRVLDVESTDE